MFGKITRTLNVLPSFLVEVGWKIEPLVLSCVCIGVVVTTLNSLPWFPCCMKFECFLISHLWSKAKQAWGETRERLTLNFFPVSSHLYNGFPINVSSPPPNYPALIRSSAIQNSARPTAAIGGFYGYPSRLPANPNWPVNQTAVSFLVC